MSNELTNGTDWLSFLPYSLTFAGGIIVAGISAMVTRSNAKDTTKSTEHKTLTEAEQTGRRDTIADRDSLIATLSTRLDELQTRMDTMEAEVREVHAHNLSLVNFILRCINVFQQLGLEHAIPKPLPKGVEI